FVCCLFDSFSDNSLTDRGVGEIANLIPKLPSLASILLGKNGCSLESIYTLLENMTSCPSIQEVYAEYVFRLDNTHWAQTSIQRLFHIVKRNFIEMTWKQH
uniref:NACHT LRR and PYD domain-containing protein n=1 Tax=Hucho hucho TaxID=62062 RepID=A0A4W5P2K0_9TELE